jgi:hypothetical protein
MRIFETTVERERNIFPSKEKNDSEDGTYFLLVKIDADGSTSILNGHAVQSAHAPRYLPKKFREGVRQHALAPQHFGAGGVAVTSLPADLSARFAAL